MNTHFTGSEEPNSQERMSIDNPVSLERISIDTPASLDRISIDNPTKPLIIEKSSSNDSNKSNKRKKRFSKKKNVSQEEVEVVVVSESESENEEEKRRKKKRNKKRNNRRNKKDKNPILKFFAKMCCGKDGYVYSLLKLNFFFRALKFLPALLITYGIELVNSANLGSNSTILQNHFSLLIFEPVLSAIAGNIGLQTSSSISSYINLQQQKKRAIKLKYLLYKYFTHNLFNAAFLSVLMGFTCYIWPKNPSDLFAIHCRIQHAVIIFFSAFGNMVIAIFAGVFTPFLLHTCKYDPSSGAGPFETALQDVLGAILFVLLARGIIIGWPLVFTVTPSTNCTLG